jgi:hypothetical protein
MKREGASGSTIVGFLVGFTIAALLAAVVVLLIRRGGPGVDTSRPTVVRQIQHLQRLETVVFGMDKIVSGGWESRYLPALLSGERLLLIVYGEVSAGIDLGRIDATSVRIDGPTIQLTLPEPQIFATRVDNDRTRVYSRETGLFTRVDPDLESEVRREAERQVRQAALDNGILRVASANAATTLTSFLGGLGFAKTVIK